VLRFWRNPEYVRHVRAELRAPRAITAALVVLVICALVALSCWGSERNDLRQFFRLFHLWLLGVQYIVLGFWCASACGQAISRERELKTYDFLKTTRLTSAELMVGKILGTPILGYFVVGCSLPISILAGFLGGYAAGTLLWAYALLLVFALFLSLLSLWLSMLLEKSSSAAVALLILLPMGWALSFAYSPFPGFGAISIFPAIFSIYKVGAEILRAKPTLFGMTTSFEVLTMLVYAALGAWFVLMLVRNLKKDREQIRHLSRWQAVGFGAFLNVLFYAFLDPKQLGANMDAGHLYPGIVASLAMGLNGLVLFAVGLATLTPHERLKVWWRRRSAGEERYFSESGLPWPWLAATALVAYALLLAEAAGLRGAIPLARWHLGAAALELLTVLIFTTRDILFLQWCDLTHMKRPLVKGFLYLCLYYVSVSIIGGVISIGSDARGSLLFQLFTPFGIFSPEVAALGARPGLYIGMGLQLLIILGILKAIVDRLRAPATVTAASAA
jgi:hypothetical protein